MQRTSIRRKGTTGSPEPGNILTNPFVDVKIDIQMSRSASAYFAALLVGHPNLLLEVQFA